MHPAYGLVGESPLFTVSEFVAVFNQSLEMLYPQVVIRGELSNFKISKQRWVYFDLKDDDASVKFFGNVFTLSGPLQDGMLCEVVGRPRLHPQFGFSISFEQIRPVGEGAIKKAQQLLERKLRSEGLFADERKRPLPYPPESVGLITSAESAAVSDFKKILAARWPSIDVTLAHTAVQGVDAPASIVAAIQKFNMLAEPPEVLIVIRGGGSADDLAAFSEESVVRAVAASRIPTLVAIGHERDVCLAELAADVRASTPSNAAELLVPHVQDERRHVAYVDEQLRNALYTLFDQQQRYIQESQERISHLFQQVLQRTRHEIERQQLLIQAFDPRQPLERGYAIIRDQSGMVRKRAADIVPGEVLLIEFTDDTIKVRQE